MLALGMLMLGALAACLGNQTMVPATPVPGGASVTPTVRETPGPAPARPSETTTPIPVPATATRPQVGLPTPALIPTPAPPLPTSTLTSIPILPSSTPSAPAAPATLPATVTGPGATSIHTVFVIVMENHNWAEIQNSPSAPYLNHTLLPMASYATQYYNPPGVHPSEPNYLWLEAGSNFGISNDAAPAANHQATPRHLVSLLTAQGLTWKAYAEGISGTICPLTARGLYAPKHNPMVFFNDVTDTNATHGAYCLAHERPYRELATDLAHNTVAAYNFITPDLCDDMHNSLGCASLDSIHNGDTWLATAVPPILNSPAYQAGGVLFITWDEGEHGSDGPIGLLVLSPFAKGHGYAGAVHYTHSALLRSIEEIFGVTPLLGGAAHSPDLHDLFQQFP